MTSGDLESRSRSTIYELDLYLGVRHLHTKAEVSKLFISGDIIRKPKEVWTVDERTDRRTTLWWQYTSAKLLWPTGYCRHNVVRPSVRPHFGFRMISPEIIKLGTSALVYRCLTPRYRSSSYMVDLDLISRSPEVIDLLFFDTLVSGWYLRK